MAEESKEKTTFSEQLEKKDGIYSPVLEAVLGIYAPDKKIPEAPLFKEVVSRCVADVAGILQTGEPAEGKKEPASTKPGAELRNIHRQLYRELDDKQGETGAARAMILGNLSGYTKGLVHTPHPTELLTEGAIDAQEKLMGALIDAKDLFKGRTVSGDKRERLQTALQNLDAAIREPLSKSLTIDQEMRRSVGFSQRQFNAIPEIANTALESIGAHSSELSVKELQRFGHLISPETWSPGDQDSKPDMTVDMLEKGAKLGRRAMMFHYFRELAVLGANTEGKSNVDAEAKQEIQTMMVKLLKSGYALYDSPQVSCDAEFARKKMLGESVNGGPANGAISEFKERYKQYADSGFMKDFMKNFAATDEKAGGAYGNISEFTQDLSRLRETGLKDIREKERVNSLDALIVEAMNFGDTALRIQIRQNADVHAKVVDKLLSLLPEDKLPPGIDKQAIGQHSEDSSRPIEALLSAFKSDAGFASLVKEKVKEQLATYDPKTKDKFYQTMQSLGFAAEHPDQVSRYLIAETRSTTDLLEAFFLLKVMEGVRDTEAKGIKNKVEIVNLVEHPDLMRNERQGPKMAQMTAGALANEQFRDHHISIKTNEHLLQDYSLDDFKAGKDGHRLTVAEAKRAFGLEIAEGDETREIKGVKMLMAAGSDVTKAGGVAAAAATMDSIERTRETLLNDKENPMLLLDYLGCGGGIHRTQPVGTQFETVQGNTMRQSPENIAQKVVSRITEFLHKKLGLQREAGNQHETYLGKRMTPSLRAKLAQVNMSNMANLNANDAMWEKHTKSRTYAMMDKYGKLYDSEEFAALMSYSADMYANLTKFAARPTSREDAGAPAGGAPAKKESGFLKKYSAEKVKEIRAIGFGAALNAAGINAPLFFGGSEYLNESLTKEPGKNPDMVLRDMYLNDPKAQDTINRMTYGVLMADMDVAWKYQGRDKAPNNAELRTLANGNPDKTDTKAMAEKALAQINREYNEVAGKLLKLHRLVAGESKVNAPIPLNGKDAADQILELLPPALSEQIESSRKNLRDPRMKLAELFDKMAKGEVDPDRVADKASDEYKNIVYPAMAAIFEFTEHAPRAYTRPKWVEATMQQQRAA